MAYSNTSKYKQYNGGYTNGTILYRIVSTVSAWYRVNHRQPFLWWLCVVCIISTDRKPVLQAMVTSQP